MMHATSFSLFVKRKAFPVVLAIVPALLAGGYAVFAFSPPTTAPPGDNVPAPINVGHAGQIKEGGLTVANSISDEFVGFVVARGLTGFGTADPQARLHVQHLALPNIHFAQNSEDSTFVFEDENAVLHLAGRDASGSMSHVLLSGVPDSGNNKHWAISHWGPTQGNQFSISYRETSGSGFGLSDFYWNPAHGHAGGWNRSMISFRPGGGQHGAVGIGKFWPDTAYKLTVAGNVLIGDNHDPNIPNDMIVLGDLEVQGSFSNPSDAQLKTNVEPLQNSLAKVLGLQGVSFRWDKDAYPKRSFADGIHIGFIAQEVERVVPELVMTNSQGDKSLDYSKMTVLLVEAMKEQQSQIDELRAELEELRSKLNGN